jgi:hypothetical protein
MARHALRAGAHREIRLGEAAAARAARGEQQRRYDLPVFIARSSSIHLRITLIVAVVR